MKAEVITVGDEILIGQTIDTNGAWLGEEFNQMGIRLNRIVSIADQREEILSSINESFGRADLIVMTGGLGPTRDDITKQTLCEYFETKLVMNTDILAKIEEYFSKRDKQILEVNRQQAEIPESATVLPNKRGTASGMWFEKNGKVLISLPGVPYEMKGIMRDYGFEKILGHFKTRKIFHRTLLTIGVGESQIAESIREWEDDLRNSGLFLAYLPSAGMVKLRISGYENGEGETALERNIDKRVAELEALVAEYIYGRDKDTLQQIIGDLLKERNASISLAESCTGGYIAQLLTSVPGCSQYFMGSVVTYSYSSKTQLLGVSAEDIKNRGAVSKETVEQMAKGVREKFNTTYSIATSGIAGPDGGTPDKPVGTVWMAVAGPGKIKSQRFQFGTSRSRNITMSGRAALNWLRKEIITKGLE